jgi:hypothetical protein
MQITKATNNPEAIASQSFGRDNALESQAPRLKHLGNKQPRALVKERVAAWEAKRFNEESKKRPGVCNISDEDDFVHDGDGADWHQLAPSGSRVQQNRDKPSSNAVSSTGSGASQSLEGRAKDRDIAIRQVRLGEAKLRFLQIGAAVGLSRRSRNSSQASSAHSDEQSVVSGSRRSHRRSISERERFLRGALAEVFKVDGEFAIAPLNDSHATTPYYFLQETRSHGAVSVGDESFALQSERSL